MTDKGKAPARHTGSQRRAADLEVLRQVGLALASIRDPDELVQHAVEVVRQAFGYYYATFLEHDAVGQELVLVGYCGDQAPPPPRRARFPCDQGLAGAAASERAPVIVGDVTADPRYVESVPGVRSEAAFPVQHGDRLFGVFSVASQQVHAFDEQAVRTLTALVNQIAVALENAQLFAAGQRRVQELTTLTETSAALNQALTLEETLDRVLQAIAGLLGEVGCSIVLIDASTNTLRMVAHRHLPPELVKAFSERPVPRDAGSFGIAIQSGEVVEIEDAQRDPRVRHDLGGIPNRITSIPLRTTEGEVIGLLVLGTLLTDPDTRRLVLALANLAAVAIQRARHFAQTRQTEVELNRQVQTLIELLDLSRKLQLPDTLAEKAHLITQGITDTGLFGRAVLTVLDREENSVAIGCTGLTPEDEALLRSLPALTPEERRRHFQERYQVGRSYYIPHDDQLTELPGVSSRRPEDSFVDWHPEDQLVVPLWGTEGRLVGSLSVDDPADGRRPTAESVRPLELFAGLAALSLESAQLLIETQRRAQEMTWLYEATAAMNAEPAADQVLTTTLSTALRLLDADVANIYLVDEVGDRYEKVGLDPEGRLYRTFETRALRAWGLTSTVERERRPLVVENTDEDPRVQPFKNYRDPRWKSLIAVPMMVRDRVIGVLYVGYTRPRSFTEQQVTQLSMLTNQAGVALENAELFRELERRVTSLTILQEVGLNTGTTLDLPTVLDGVAEGALRLMRANSVQIFLYDEDQETFTVGAGLDQAGRHGQFLRMPRRDGLTATVARTKQPMIIQDVLSHPLYQEPGARIAGLRSIAGFPIQRGNRVVGVFDVAFNEAHVFTVEECQLLELLASQAAGAIENARLYQEARAAEQRLSRQVNVLTTLLSVAHALQALGELQPKLDLVAQGVVDAGLWRRAVISVFGENWCTEAMGAAGLTPEEVEALQQLPEPTREERMRLYDERFRVSASYYIPYEAESPSEGRVRSQRRAEEFIDWNPHDVLLVPLYGAGGRIVGQLSVDDPVEGRRPTAESLKPLELFANQAAVAVENYRLFGELRLVNRDLEEMLDTQRQLLQVVQELSSPVVPIFEGVLVMPLVGAIDSTRAQQITRALLRAIEGARARVVLIDITGVPVMDSHVARYLADAMQSARLVGAEPVLVGISPAVAQTLVQIRADLGDVVKRSDLQSGVAYALRRRGRDVVSRPGEEA